MKVTASSSRCRVWSHAWKTKRANRVGWGDTVVTLPASVTGEGSGRWKNLLTGAVIDAETREEGAVLAADKLLGGFPLALLVAA